MKLNWKARYRRAPVLALMVAMVVLAAIPHSLSGADPRDQAAPAKEQAPRETPAAVFERDPAVEFYVDLDLLTRSSGAGPCRPGGRRTATLPGRTDPAAAPQGGPDRRGRRA